MSAILRIKQSKKSLNEDQKAFRRLKNQLETLKDKERKRHIELDKGLLFYHEKLRVEEEKIDRALEERIELSYQLYRTTKSFSKNELNMLKELILCDIENLLKSVGIQGLPKKVEEIGKDLGWKGAEETLARELSPMIEDIENMFASQGIKVDLSHVDVKDTQEEIIQKLFEQVKIGMDQRENLSEKEPPKRAKGLQKNEELQNKSMNAIYKQLAKVLHPDFEFDPEKKAKKEEQMKKLTVAYENSDLSTLLELEQEWIDSSNGPSSIKNSDQLKTYNQILRQQIDMIKDRIEMLFLHPRYLPLQRFYEDRFTGMPPLLEAYEDVQIDLENIQSIADQLKSPQAVKILKQTLQQEKILQEMKNHLFDQFFG